MGCLIVFSFDRLSTSRRPRPWPRSIVLRHDLLQSTETLLIFQAQSLCYCHGEFLLQRSAFLKICNTCWSTTLIISNSCCSTSLIISNSCSSTSLIIIIVGIIIAFLGQNLPVELYYNNNNIKPISSLNSHCFLNGFKAWPSDP